MVNMGLMLIFMEIVLTLEVEIDLIIYLGDIVEIINVKISLGVDADFDGDLNMRISKNVGLEVYGTFLSD
jgi:hypothetical protein